MERILKAFKDLFICENPVKRHFMYVLLMVLPAIAGGFAGFIDKDTPNEVVVVLLAFVAFFLILSIVPAFCMLGFATTFCELRLKGETGIPKITSELFMKGLKSFPLFIVWGFYYAVLGLTCIGLPIAIAIVSSIATKDNPLGIVAIVLVTFFVIALLSIVLTILSPFLNFVFIKFIKGNYTYKAQYFNPFVLIDYIKKAFKETIMVMLKMILASFILTSISSIISVVIVMFMMAFVFMMVLLIPEEAGKDSTYHPLVVIVFVAFSALAGLVQAYVSCMVASASSDLYIEVYKNKIEPTENEFEI